MPEDRQWWRLVSRVPCINQRQGQWNTSSAPGPGHDPAQPQHQQPSALPPSVRDPEIWMLRKWMNNIFMGWQHRKTKISWTEPWFGEGDIKETSFNWILLPSKLNFLKLLQSCWQSNFFMRPKDNFYFNKMHLVHWKPIYIKPNQQKMGSTRRPAKLTPLL